MTENYAIAAELKLFDLVSPALLRLSGRFEKFDAIIAATNTHLKELMETGKGMGRLNKRLLEGVEAGKLLNDTFLASGKSLEALGLASTGIDAVVHSTSALDRALLDSTASARELKLQLKEIKGLRIASGLNVGEGGGKGGSGRHGGVHVGANGVGLPSASLGLGDAAVPLALGAAATYGGYKTYAAARDYETAFAQFQTLNLGTAINADAAGFAQQTKQFGVSMKERIAMLRDLYEILGDYKDAKELTPMFTQMAFDNETVFGDQSHFGEPQMQLLGKVLEQRGGTKNKAALKAQANVAQQAFAGAAGMLDPEDYYAFIQRGRTAAMQMSNEAFWIESAPMIQEMGGAAFGTAVNSMQQGMGLGRSPEKVIKELARLGVIDPAALVRGKNGQVKAMRPGGLKDMELFNRSKYHYLLDDLVPAIKKAGVMSPSGKMIYGDAIDDDLMVGELNAIAGKSTAGNGWAQMFLQRGKIQKNIDIANHAMGLDQLHALAQGTTQGAQNNAGKAWEDYKTTVGKNVTGPASSVNNWWADFLRAISTGSHNLRDLFSTHGATDYDHQLRVNRQTGLFVDPRPQPITIILNNNMDGTTFERKVLHWLGLDSLASPASASGTSFDHTRHFGGTVGHW